MGEAKRAGGFSVFKSSYHRDTTRCQVSMGDSGKPGLCNGVNYPTQELPVNWVTPYCKMMLDIHVILDSRVNPDGSHGTVL